MIGSSVPLRGLHYNRETMTFDGGIAHDGHLVNLDQVFSQTHYVGESGKEKVLTRIEDKVIPNEADLMKHLSSFDVIIAIETNTKQIGAETLSVSGIVKCQVRGTDNRDAYSVDILSRKSILLQDCPDEELPPEKFGWMKVIEEVCREPVNATRTFCLVSDHDLDNHHLYNCRKLPIFKDAYLPSNFTITYGKGDSSKESILNYLVQVCDKQATNVLREIEEEGR